MSIGRSWKGTDQVPKQGQKIILDSSWINVTVKRITDDSRNVGVTAELDEHEEVFTIKARIDPVEDRQKTKKWIGLVEDHILPMMRRGDHWYTENPDEKAQGYKVTDVNGDEITLEKL